MALLLHAFLGHDDMSGEKREREREGERERAGLAPAGLSDDASHGQLAHGVASVDAPETVRLASKHQQEMETHRSILRVLLLLGRQ
jgi:hypothetical protein